MISSIHSPIAASAFRRGSRGIVSVFALFAFVMALARPVSAQDLDVFFDGSELKVAGQFDRKPHYSSASASEAIQFALDHAGKTGGSVRLGSGRFHLDEALQVPGQIRLSGAGRATKLMVSPKNAGGIAIVCKEAHGAEVSDLCLSAGDNQKALVGMIIDASGEMKVRNVSAIGFADFGIWVRNHAFLCEISSCVLAGNGKVNLYLENMHAGTFGNFIPNLIANCTIFGGGKGIECNHVIVLNIVGCSIYQTNGTGIHLHSQSNSVLVSACRTFQITGDAMVLEGNTHEVNMTGNIFCWSTGHGIVVRHSAWGTITGNNIIDIGSCNPGGKNFTTRFADMKEEIPLKNGISLVQTRGFTISSNTIFNWNLAPKMRFGIHEDNKSFKNIITGNNVNFTFEDSVLAEGTESLVRDNVSLADITHAQIGKLEGGKAIQGPYKTDGFVQTYQPELTQRFIESLK